MSQITNTKKRKPQVDISNAQSDTEMNEKIEVTFEFCDLNPIDYHAIKHLISQLFRIDRATSTITETGTEHTPSIPLPPSKAPLKPVLEDLDVGELTDLILGEQKEWVGCTVKCDEEDCDPYAFISVIDLRAYQEKPSVLGLIRYLSSVLTSSARTSHQAKELLEIFQESLKPRGDGIGLVMSERLINMPVQVIPQLFTQLGNEIKHAQSKNASGFQFNQLLIPSRVFITPPNQDSKDEINPTFEVNNNSQRSNSNKKNKSDINANDGIGLYHPEDEIISQFASHTIQFNLARSNQNSLLSSTQDNVDFGIQQEGRLMLIPLAKWDEMVKCLGDFISDPN